MSKDEKQNDLPAGSKKPHRYTLDIVLSILFWLTLCASAKIATVENITNPNWPFPPASTSAPSSDHP